MTITATDATIMTHFFDGAETAGSGGRSQPVYNPATSRVSAELRLANQEGIQSVVAAARTAADLVVGCVDTLEDAIQMINTSPYGNGTAIFPSSGAHGHHPVLAGPHP